VCIGNAKKYRICGHHFEENQYANAVKKCRLRKDAVPTKFKVNEINTGIKKLKVTFIFLLK